MRITLRDIDPVAVKKIDTLAKEKKMSRNQFFKIQIKKMATLPELNVEKDKMTLTLDKVIDAMYVQQTEMKEIKNALNRLTNLIAVTTDMSANKIEKILNNENYKGE